MRLQPTLLLALCALLAVQAIAGCSRKKDDGTAPISGKGSLPALTIRDDTPELMLTWIDDKGETHVELHPAEVPAAGRAMVRVVVSDREDGTRDLFYVADLTKKDADGGYGTQTMSRRAWESEIEKRRAAYLAKVSPPPLLPSGQASAGAPPGATERPPSTGLTATVYGASWCGPCHEAEGYLKSKGVRVIMKDVEKTPDAAAEMRDKLERSGQRNGAIPVIDVRGQILVGFSRSAVDRAIAKAATGTVL
jgi:glutaredoxin